MAVSANKIHLSGLARKLVIDGLLDEAAAHGHFQKAQSKKQPFVAFLVENKIVPSNAIALAASQEFGIPVLDINALELDMEIVKLVKEHKVPCFSSSASWRRRRWGWRC